MTEQTDVAPDVLILEYVTDVMPVAEDRRRRSESQERIRTLREKGKVKSINLQQVDPYSFRELQAAVQATVESKDYSSIFFDISCLTKIHTIALADLDLFGLTPTRWSLAYTMPETYGHVTYGEHRGPGWRDILILPIAEAGELVNESSGRGVILTGYEDDRLIVALGEMDPVGGVALTANTRGRPDLRRENETRNKPLLRRLRLRHPAEWDTQTIDLLDIAGFTSRIREEIAKAKGEDAPVILFPFGPKPWVFFAAMQLAAEHPTHAWFVYPVPFLYDVDYSYGSGVTMYFEVPDAVAPAAS